LFLEIPRNPLVFSTEGKEVKGRHRSDVHRKWADKQTHNLDPFFFLEAVPEELTHVHPSDNKEAISNYMLTATAVQEVRYINKCNVLML
jgi:hypothetical protein